MEVPETRYAHSGEIAIAYQVHGSGEHDLLFSGTTTGNLETVWALPEAALNPSFVDVASAASPRWTTPHGSSGSSRRRGRPTQCAASG